MKTIAAIKRPIADLEVALLPYGTRLLAISFTRRFYEFVPLAIRITDHLTGEFLAEWPWTGMMGTAIVAPDGIVHIFGSTNATNTGNKVIHSTLDPVTFAPSMPIDALLMNSTTNPFKIYNTDITSDPNGYRMVVETSVGTFFGRSTDLNSWNYFGGQLASTEYVGCPTIDYVSGAHYLTYLKKVGANYVTQVAKSIDNCFTFTYFSSKGVNAAGSYLLAPDGNGDGINTSDASFAEFNGKVYGIYLNGDQSTWADSHRFEYNGTLAQLFAEFF